MQMGRVTRWDIARGFGFVATDDGRDVFCHASQLPAGWAVSRTWAARPIFYADQSAAAKPGSAASDGYRIRRARRCPMIRSSASRTCDGSGSHEQVRRAEHSTRRGSDRFTDRLCSCRHQARMRAGYQTLSSIHAPSSRPCPCVRHLYLPIKYPPPFISVTVRGQLLSHSIVPFNLVHSPTFRGKGPGGGLVGTVTPGKGRSIGGFFVGWS
jgi:hypothetical protein